MTEGRTTEGSRPFYAGLATVSTKIRICPQEFGFDLVWTSPAGTIGRKGCELRGGFRNSSTKYALETSADQKLNFSAN